MGTMCRRPCCKARLSAPDRCAGYRLLKQALVIRSVREHLQTLEPIDDPSLIRQNVARVEVQPEQLVIELAGFPDPTLRRPTAIAPSGCLGGRQCQARDYSA